MIYEYLANGGNIKNLLLATGIDYDTFILKLEWNKFNADERKIIKQTINEQ